MKRYVVTVLVLIALAAGGVALAKSKGSTKVQAVILDIEKKKLPPPQATTTIASIVAAAPEKKPPETLNLPVPFVVQAPFGVWDHLHDNTCEETAVAMADAYFDGRTFTPQQADDELRALVDWEIKKFGYFEDTTVAEVLTILHEYYGRSAEEKTVVSVASIKHELLAGNLVLLPLYGIGLNPFFRREGPDYHMIVIRGYTKDKFITNEPGTRHGESYPYRFEDLMEQVHDWNEGDVINGRRVMIVVYPDPYVAP